MEEEIEYARLYEIVRGGGKPTEEEIKQIAEELFDLKNKNKRINLL